MRRQWGWMLAVLILGLQGCSCGSPADSDGGTGGGGGAGGGSGGGAGGGTGGGGGVIDAGTGPRLLGCEVDGGTSATPECTPTVTGCQTPSDCDAGLCLTLATGGVCTRACTVLADCDTGWTCLSRWTGAGPQGFCAPARRTP